MQNRFSMLILAIISLLLMNSVSIASPQATRTMQFSNNKVTVWETVIYPGANQALKMHRHEYDRIIVAFDDGVLKITNDKGEVHYLKMEKDKAYYLSKDVPGELHNDENMSKHPIKVLVAEIKN